MDNSPRLGVYRMRLRVYLEVLHTAIFFRASAYFQIKENEDMTKPNTPEYRALEDLEVRGYVQAKSVRAEILQDVSYAL
jgi:E3 ubiquitin-protein ligase SHPRH